MTEDIIELLNNRKKKDSLMGHIKPNVIERKYDVTIIERKNLYGLADIEGRYLFPPVYDDIHFLNESGLIYLCISGKKALYSTKSNKLVIDFECDEISINDSYDTVDITISGKHGLWGVYEDRFLITVEYDDVTCRSDCQYLWAYVDMHYCFIEKETGRLISISKAQNVYDTKEGMYIQFEETGNVVSLNPDGYLDNIKLRRMVKNNNGRYTFRNTKKELKDIIDIYGRILNR